MLDKSLVNAYGEPVHTYSLSLHLPSPSGSQEDEFLPDRRQTALRSVAGGEPHALLYGSSLCAKAFAPVKGKGHSHHTAANLRLVSLSPFAPVAAHATSAYSGRGVFVASLLTHYLLSHPQPPMSQGSYAPSASAAIAALRRVSYRLTDRTDTPRVRLFRSLPLRPAPQSGCESAYACGYGSPLTAFAGAHTACAALQPNAQSSLSCNACGGPGHTQRRQSAGSPFPFPASPTLSLRSGVSAL